MSNFITLIGSKTVYSFSFLTNHVPNKLYMQFRYALDFTLSRTINSLYILAILGIWIKLPIIRYLNLFLIRWIFAYSSSTILTRAKESEYAAIHSRCVVYLGEVKMIFTSQ